jgi:error-prone DNA polymerase
MGFYSPATIVEDARRHGLVVRPICAQKSEWDCTLEGPGDRNGGTTARCSRDHAAASGALALRMGLRYVKGLSDVVAQRMIAARPYADLEDFVRRSGMPQSTLSSLAEAGAFEGFGVARRDALWQVRGLVRGQHDALPVPAQSEQSPVFAALGPLDTILWDYRATAHSARGHPLGPLRGELAALGLPDARTVLAMPDGRRVRYAGLVICRQRPGTASGVVFMTLEDETGIVNLVVWPKIFDRYALLARTAPFLGVTGRLQVEQGVIHVIADELWAPVVTRPPPETESRDFH